MHLAKSEQSPLAYNPKFDLFISSGEIKGVTLEGGIENGEALNMAQELGVIAASTRGSIIKFHDDERRAYVAELLGTQLTVTLGQLGTGNNVAFTLLNPDAYPYLKGSDDDNIDVELGINTEFYNSLFKPRKVATSLLTDIVYGKDILINDTNYFKRSVESKEAELESFIKPLRKDNTEPKRMKPVIHENKMIKRYSIESTSELDTINYKIISKYPEDEPKY